MKRLLLLFGCLFIVLICYPQNGEEFVGEFSSWANVKTRFRAAGDGKKDDTRALQLAIDSLSVPPKNYNMGRTAYATIYLPAGKYRITSTLLLKGKIGIQIIGEDPRTTLIVWDGQPNQKMLLADGSAYFKIARVTWNANLKTGITGIGLHWLTKWDDQVSQSFAPLNINITDCNFIGKPDFGITGGTYPGQGTGANDSEVAIQRCYFSECTNAGINITGFNALDYWVWDCRFIKCKIGIANAHGNYHAYRCYFEGSTESDFINDNGYYTSVRGCYSVNSMYFSNDRGASCNPFKRIFQGNQVQPLQGNSIYFAHVGKPMFIDNVFSKGRTQAGDYTLHYSSWCPGIYQVLSVGNKYAMAEPLRMQVARKRTFAMKDVYKFPGELITSKQSFLDSQEQRPAKIKRKIFEVPRNSSGEGIQALINQAAALKGSRPVIHFPVGYFTIENTLVIPAGSDMQLIGDGNIYASVIREGRNFPKRKPMIKVNGPSNVVIRDLQLGEHDGSENDITAVEFVNVDQQGSLAILDQLHTSSTTSVDVNAQDYLYVQKQNSFFSTGNKVTGGKLAAAKSTAGLYCYGGQFADLSVKSKGKFVSKDCWWEGNKRTPLDIEGSGTITMDGIMIAPVGADSNTTIAINQFNGKISIMNAYIQGGISVRPDNPSLNLLLWNIHFYHKMNPTQFITRQSNYKGAFLGLSTQCFNNANPACANINSIEDRAVKITDDDSFVLDMITQDREAIPRKYSGRSDKGSSVLVSRVSVGNTRTAIRFTK